MGYTFQDVGDAIESLTKILGCGPSRGLQQEFEAGLHPTLLSYDKVEVSHVSVPMLTRYLVGAASWLHQPANYYNIFSTCRCVNMVQFLNNAIVRLRGDEAKGLEARLERLKRAEKRDAFDAVAFELITAARYSAADIVDEVEFIAETATTKTPDFLVRCGPFEMFVECKKIDRTQNFTMAVRNAARDLLNPVLTSFRSRDMSVLVDVTFHEDPQTLGPQGLIDACVAALGDGTAIVDSHFTVQASRLPPFNGEITLYPSPKFSWERYGYKVRSEWIGLVNQLEGRPARMKTLPKMLQGGASTWLAGIRWDSAAKWKVSSDSVIGKYRRFAFDGVFKGLEQLEARGLNSTLHVWLESDYYTGHRQGALMDLFNRLASQKRHRFGWLVINETLFDVSPKGAFDLIEHAHPIHGPKALSPSPLVTTVFVPTDSVEQGGDFGVGAELPDVDE